MQAWRLVLTAALGLAVAACSGEDGSTSADGEGTEAAVGTGPVGDQSTGADIPDVPAPTPEADFGSLEIDCASGTPTSTCSLSTGDWGEECTVTCAVESPCPPAAYTWDGSTSFFKDRDGTIADENWTCIAEALASGGAVRVDLTADDIYVFGGEHYSVSLWRLQPDVVVVRRVRSYHNDIGDSEYSLTLRAVAPNEGALDSCLSLDTAKEQFFCVVAVGDGDVECASPERLTCPAR